MPVEAEEALQFYADATVHLKTFVNEPAAAYPKRLWIRSENAPPIPPSLTVGAGETSVELTLPAIKGLLPQQLLLLVSLQALCYATSTALGLSSIGLEKFIATPKKP